MTTSEHSPDLADGDFVELSYTARIADDGRIIDTTDPAVAADAVIDDVAASGPCVVILGEDHLFDPVEAAIKETGVGESGRTTVDPEAAFGEFDPTATRVVDTDELGPNRRTNGSRVVHDGDAAFVESVDDEGATLNFNHPLAGMPIEYTFTVHRRVTGFDDRVEGLVAMYGLGEELSVSREATSDGLQLSVTNPDSGLDRWNDQKQRLVTDLVDHLSVDEVRVVERYSPR
jgi:FKBP-type peptidyl-prolyl cis-trans isomerase SlyD